MAHVVDVAAYILECLGSVSTMKLQKLTFYSQAYYLVEHGTPLFPEEFEAWANGPVAPDLFKRHKGEFVVSRGFFGPLLEHALTEYEYGDRPCRWLPEELDGSQSQRIDS